MALDAERIVDLAPAGQFGLVDRYLPDPYRRALTRDGDPMASLTRATRTALRRALSELEAVQRSRALAFFDDLSDGALLGSLHDQAPWPEDTTESYRDRLTRVSALAMRGAATADRLMLVAAIACGAARLSAGDGAALIGPKQDFDFTLVQKGADGSENRQTFAGTTGEGQSRRYVAKSGSRSVFAIDVLDAPLRRFETDIKSVVGANGQPDRDYRFVLDNPASETLGGLDLTDPITWPDPIFEVTAGDRPFGPFGFVNTFTSEVIFVNRIIAPKGALSVDTRQMTWKHGTAQSKLAHFMCFGEKAAIYAGFALSLDDHSFGTRPLGPLLSLRTKERVTFTGAKSNGPPTSSDLTPDLDLELPSLLGEGQSQWRLIELANDTPDTDDIHEARFQAVRGNADITLSAYWYGRRPGEFTLAVPPTALAPDLSGPLAHRAQWLDQMVERFKLAGTVRISQDLLFDRFEGFEETTELTFTDRITPADTMLMTDPLVLRDSVAPRDTVRILEDITVNVASALRPTDGIVITKTSAQPDDLQSSVQPTDSMTLSSGLPAGFRSVLTLRDSVSILPELSFAWRSVGVPNDAVVVVDNNADPDTLRSVVRPTGGIVVTAGLPADFTSILTPTDHIVVQPEVSFEGRSTVVPTDTLIATDDEKTPDDLRSKVIPRDDIVVTEGLPPVFNARVFPVDTIAVLPEVDLTYRSPVNPTDNVSVIDTEERPKPLRSTTTPTDRITLIGDFPPVIRVRITPTDSIALEPGKRPDRDPQPNPDDDPVRPGGGDDIGDTEPHVPIVFPVIDDADVLRFATPVNLNFQSTVHPKDRFTIRRRRR